jgi:voltage-gated potassium channel
VIHGQHNTHGSVLSGATPMGLLRQSRLWVGIKWLFLLQFFGSAGYFVLGQAHYKGLIEPQLDQPWSVLDCVYMTVITISTIGYGEVFPTPSGSLEGYTLVRSYTIVLVMIAMILVAYSVSSATAFLVNGDLQRLFERRRAMNQISKLDGHTILCGCGVTGTVILEELLASGHRVVAIDKSHERLTELSGSSHVTTLHGDATDDDVLQSAGIAKARGLAATLPSDKDNLFLIISAKQFNPELRVASLASNQSVRDKLIRAGANSVVSSSFIGGLRLASELMRPAVVGFLDNMLCKTESPVRFAQVHVGPAWAGKTLGALDSSGNEGLPVLALKLPGSNDFTFNPTDDTKLEPGMELVTMGETVRVQDLMKRIGDTTVPTFIGGEDDASDEAAE